MNQKSLDKKKTSEIFEGVNSSLHQSFVEAVERDKEPKKISACCNAEVATANSGLVGETNYYICTKCHNDCDVIAEPKKLDRKTINIPELQLSRHNALSKANIKTYGDLKNYGINNLTKIKNIGPSSAIIIKRFLEKQFNVVVKKESAIKKLEWEKDWKKLVKVNFDGLNGKTYGKGETELKVELLGLIFISKLLTQQRTELLEEIKKMELKHSINPNSPSRERKIIYNQAIMDVINLLNKKDE